METLLITKKINKSKQVVVDLPQLNEGNEIELLIMVKSLPKLTKPKNGIFDMAQWSNKCEPDLGDNIQSINIESFTGRRC